VPRGTFSSEIRHLQIAGIDAAASTIRLAKRPHPVPLGTQTLDRCPQLVMRQDRRR
jgi:hypothetical protein